MTTTSRHSEIAFETVIERHLLGQGYVAVARDGFDRDRAIFPGIVLVAWPACRRRTRCPVRTVRSSTRRRI